MDSASLNSIKNGTCQREIIHLFIIPALPAGVTSLWQSATADQKRQPVTVC